MEKGFLINNSASNASKMGGSDGADHTNLLNQELMSNIVDGTNDKIHVDTVSMQNTKASPSTSGANVQKKGTQSGSIPISFADMFKDKTPKKTVKISEMRNDNCVPGANVTIPLEAIDEVSSRFANTLYGYFIGKRLAFPIVDNYVRNTWAKFGLQRVMLNNGFFLFQFETKAGMERVLEEGPWFIRMVPIFLNIWTPNTKLTKDDITLAPVWVKLHNIPVVAYSEVGLSLITTQIGRPIMLDSYTSTMCLKSWGRNSYARALVEVSSKEALLDSLVVAIPYPNGSGHSLEKIDIEYEWKPPRCETCKVFDHNDDGCTKRVKPVMENKSLVDEEGFVEAYKKKGKGKLQGTNRQVDGIRFQKPKVSYYYRPVTKPKNGGASASKPSVQSNTGSPTVNVGSTFCNEPTTDLTSSTTPPRDDQGKNNNWVDDINLVDLKNSFDVLTEQDSVLEPVIGTTCTPEVISSSSKNTSPSPMKNTPIVDKIGKLEKLIIDGKATLVDDDGKPLKNNKEGSNPFSKVGNVVVSDSEDDEVFDDHIGSLYSEWKADTGDDNYYDDDDFGLSHAQLKAAGIQDFCLK